MRKGFTLIELLLVVAILGILAGLIIPEYANQTEKARVAEALDFLQNIRKGENLYKLEVGTYLAVDATGGAMEWNKLGLDDLNSDALFLTRLWNYSVSSDGAIFTAIATRNAQPDPSYENLFVGLKQDGAFCGDHPFGPNSTGSCP